MTAMAAWNSIARASSATAKAHRCRWSNLDIAAVLSLATHASCRRRRKAALALASVMRRTTSIYAGIDTDVEAVGRKYGNEVAAAARVIASELHLS
jgi:hypothetical protein